MGQMDDEKIVKEALIVLVNQLKERINILENKLNSSEECGVFLLGIALKLNPDATRESILANNDDLHKLTNEQIADFIDYIDSSMHRYLRNSIDSQ